MLIGTTLEFTSNAMKMNSVGTVSDVVSSNEKHEFDLEQALNIVGIGVYNLKYCLLLALFLIASLMEVIGYSFVLPAARCDLHMSDSQRGIIASLTYIAIVLTSFPWGYVVDTRGRKPMLILGSLAVGSLSVIAAFMPNLVSFTAFKFAANLFLACPSSVPYAFIGEILPQKHRDFALSLTNALQMLGAAVVPLLAWGILPLQFEINFGTYNFKSWRLLSIIYSSVFLLCGGLMFFGPESPKFLLSQGREDEALEVLRTMYAANKRKAKDEFPVKVLKKPLEEFKKPNTFLSSIRLQILPVLKPPYLKWLCLNGFLLFGIFASLNGLFMWVPDVLNRVLSGTGTEGLTACQVIRLGIEQNNQTEQVECDNTLDTSTFAINSVANIGCAVIIFSCSASVKIIGKKALLVLMYFVIGSFCITINFITNNLAFAALLISLQISSLGIGPVNAFAVEIFPTNLRGMAVSLALMVGRMGSAIGTNVAGILINNSCEATFYGFGGLLLLCGVLSFLLPRSKKNYR